MDDDPVRVRLEPDALVITLRGALDAPHVATDIVFVAALEGLRRLPPRPLVVELADVPTIDSTGIGVLSELAAISGKGGRKLRIRGATSLTRRQMEAGHLTELADVDAAGRAPTG